jgi:hypothetical protein
MSEEARRHLVDKLADVAMQRLWRAHELNEIATKVRGGDR